MTYVMAGTLAQSLAGCSKEPAVNNGVGAEPKEGATAPLADERLIIAFGDSLYAGYGVAQNESFPNALQRALRARGVAAVVRNAGVSGETTLGGLQRLNFTLDGLPRKPDLLLLGLGGNDMLRGIDPAESERNLRKILDELKKRQIDVMLTGILAAPNMGADYAQKFNPIYSRLAKDYGVPLYPFFLEGVIGNRQLMQADSIHPAAQGVVEVVRRMTPSVAEALEDVR